MICNNKKKREKIRKFFLFTLNRDVKSIGTISKSNLYLIERKNGRIDITKNNSRR
jgi:hypothetical protein